MANEKLKTEDTVSVKIENSTSSEFRKGLSDEPPKVLSQEDLLSRRKSIKLTRKSSGQNKDATEDLDDSASNVEETSYESE